MTQTPPIRSTRRLLAGLALVAALGLAAAGCGDDGDGEDQAQDGVQAQRDPSGLDPVELPGSNGQPDEPNEGDSGDGKVKRPNEPEPNVDLTGPPAEVWPEIQAYRTWLFKHPDPAKAKRITHPECACYESDVELLTHYAEQGLWWTGGEIEVLDVKMLWVADEQTHAKISVDARRPEEAKLVDETGKVHDTLEPQENTTEYVLTREGPGEPWRAVAYELIEER